MLIKCPECELQISDKAINCPHCGYPLQPNVIKRKRKKLGTTLAFLDILHMIL